jgi:hypothetical protein
LGVFFQNCYIGDHTSMHMPPVALCVLCVCVCVFVCVCVCLCVCVCIYAPIHTYIEIYSCSSRCYSDDTCSLDDPHTLYRRVQCVCVCIYIYVYRHIYRPWMSRLLRSIYMSIYTHTLFIVDCRTYVWIYRCMFIYI